MQADPLCFSYANMLDTHKIILRHSIHEEIGTCRHNIENQLQSNLDYLDPFGHGCPDNWNHPDNKNQYSTIWAHVQINDIHVLYLYSYQINYIHDIP